MAIRSGPGNKADGKITLFTGVEEGNVDIEACFLPETQPGRCNKTATKGGWFTSRRRGRSRWLIGETRDGETTADWLACGGRSRCWLIGRRRAGWLA